MKFLDLIIRPAGGTTRTKSIVKLFADQIKTGERILDFGAGDGQIANYISKHFEVDLSLVDIVDYNRTKLKLTLFDGKHLPFKDDSFDSVLVIFVLHHSDHQMEILKEIKRVSKKIIIIEDTPKNWIERKFWHFWDWLLNLGHDVPMTYTAKQDAQWLLIFKSLGLKIIKKRNFRPFLPIFGMYQQTLYVLEK